MSVCVVSPCPDDEGRKRAVRGWVAKRGLQQVQIRGRYGGKDSELILDRVSEFAMATELDQ